MCRHNKYLFIVIFLINPCAFSYTFENVVINLSKNPLGTPENHWTVFDEPPKKTIHIKHDNHLRKYIINETLQDIVIWGQNLSILTTNSIRNLTGTQQIIINYCRLKIIEPKTFRNLPNLQVLDLKMNALNEIKNGVFNGLNISYLYLNDNQINKIGLRAFQNMTKLKVLRLANNRISVWYYQWLIGSSSIQSLYVHSNFIEELYSDSFDFFDGPQNYTQIEAIDFGNNKLTTIDMGTFRFIDKVKYLNFDDNQLDRLEPMVFQRLKNVHILKLNNNSINHLDELVFKHIEVHYFYLLDNNLKCVNKKLIKMIKAKKVFVDGNPISCHCVKMWEEWRNNNQTQWKRKAFPIDNFENFQENCVVNSL